MRETRGRRREGRKEGEVIFIGIRDGRREIIIIEWNRRMGKGRMRVCGCVTRVSGGGGMVVRI